MPNMPDHLPVQYMYCGLHSDLGWPFQCSLALSGWKQVESCFFLLLLFVGFPTIIGWVQITTLEQGPYLPMALFIWKFENIDYCQTLFFLCQVEITVAKLLETWKFLQIPIYVVF